MGARGEPSARDWEEYLACGSTWLGFDGGDGGGRGTANGPAKAAPRHGGGGAGAPRWGTVEGWGPQGYAPGMGGRPYSDRMPRHRRVLNERGRAQTRSLRPEF